MRSRVEVGPYIFRGAGFPISRPVRVPGAMCDVGDIEALQIERSGRRFVACARFAYAMCDCGRKPVPIALPGGISRRRDRQRFRHRARYPRGRRFGPYRYRDRRFNHQVDGASQNGRFLKPARRAPILRKMSQASVRAPGNSPRNAASGKSQWGPAEMPRALPIPRGRIVGFSGNRYPRKPPAKLDARPRLLPWNFAGAGCRGQLPGKCSG